MSYSNCSARGEAGITVAFDSNKEYAKIYTQSNTSVSKSSTGEFYITIPDTGYRPSSEFTVGGAGICSNLNSSYLGYAVAPAWLVFKTNGTIEVHGQVFSSSGQTPEFTRVFLHNSVIVLKDFSDTPQPE